MKNTKTMHSKTATPLALYGFLYPKPGKVDELREILLSFVEPTRQEEGNIEYHIYEDDGFFLYELWKSKEDLERHNTLPHIQRFLNSRMDYLKRDVEAHFGTMLSPYTKQFRT